MNNFSWHLDVNFRLMMILLQLDTEADLLGLNESLNYLSAAESQVWGNKDISFCFSTVCYSITQLFQGNILLNCLCTVKMSLQVLNWMCVKFIDFTKYKPVPHQNESKLLLRIQYRIVCECDSVYMFSTNILIKVRDSLLSNICSYNSVVNKCHEMYMAHG